MAKHMTTEPVRAQRKFGATSLRQVFGSFVTGVTVVTTMDAQNQPRGLTANSFTSVSMEPPLVLVCIGRSAVSHDEFCATNGFAINILSASQQRLSGLFATKAPDKFEQTAWRKERSGAPVLNEVLAWIDCAAHEKVIAGDHAILIGRVLDFGHGHGLPLGFFGGSYITFNFDQDSKSLAEHHPVIGGIVEVGERILLCRDVAGNWDIPAKRHLGAYSSGREALVKKCLALGVSIEPTFIYSIFTNDDGSLAIVYRCVTNAADARLCETGEARLFAFDKLPWAKITMQPIRTMLTRYIHERANDRFGVYVESEDGGKVGVLDGAPTAFHRYQLEKDLG